MTGTDLSDGRIFPGFSVHEELALLVDAGFTPNEAIQAATRVPAEFLRLNDAGTVQHGKRADLVLVGANPLDDLRNTTKIAAVVLRGRMLNRARLDALLRDVERLAAQYDLLWRSTALRRWALRPQFKRDPLGGCSKCVRLHIPSPLPSSSSCSPAQSRQKLG